MNKDSQKLYQDIERVYTPEGDYVRAVSTLGKTLAREANTRGAITCAWYANNDKLADQLLVHLPPEDRARTHFHRAHRATSRSKAFTLYQEAAKEYQSAGMLAHAAMCLDKANQPGNARILWLRLCQTIQHASEGDLYASALARFNLARALRTEGNHKEAQTATVASVHLLEEAADQYERIGQRERAFDCYQVLVAIGQDSATIEHALEGFVNLTRILREDQLPMFAIREYAGAIEYLRERSEFAAATTLCRDMADCARKQGFDKIANKAMHDQARMWCELASITAERGLAPEIAENALLAAVLAFAELGQYRDAGRTYRTLATLPIEATRRAHYSRAVARYGEAQNQPLSVDQVTASHHTAASSSGVWYDDLIEWEQRGSASSVCAEIMLDRQKWSEVSCRNAMIARLIALSVEDPKASSIAVVSLVEQLAKTELYAAIAPLEALFRRSDTAVRVAVVRALGRFLYKRSFVTLRMALNDPKSAVQSEACASIRKLSFPHAFEPLARIYREASKSTTRCAALGAMALMDSDEAANFVLSMLQQSGPTEQKLIVGVLSASIGQRCLDAVRKALPTAAGGFGESLRLVVQTFGSGSSSDEPSRQMEWKR